MMVEGRMMSGFSVSAASSQTHMHSQGMKPAGRPFKRGFDRLASVNSPCKKARTAPGFAQQQTLSVKPVPAQSQQHPVKTVVLKPPSRDAVPGRAWSKAKAQLCSSTYDREAERQALENLFQPQLHKAQDAVMQSRDDAVSVVDASFAGPSQARIRGAEDKDSLWARASCSCQPGQKEPITPLPKRIEVQKAKRLEPGHTTNGQFTQQRATNIEPRIEVSILPSQRCADGEKKMPESNESKTPGPVNQAPSEAKQKKQLTGPQLLQLRALQEELKAAEGTVMELQRLIAELENG